MTCFYIQISIIITFVFHVNRTQNQFNVNVTNREPVLDEKINKPLNRQTELNHISKIFSEKGLVSTQLSEISNDNSNQLKINSIPTLTFDHKTENILPKKLDLCKTPNHVHNPTRIHPDTSNLTHNEDTHLPSVLEKSKTKNVGFLLKAESEDAINKKYKYMSFREAIYKKPHVQMYPMEKGTNISQLNSNNSILPDKIYSDGEGRHENWSHISQTKPSNIPFNKKLYQQDPFNKESHVVTPIKKVIPSRHRMRILEPSSIKIGDDINLSVLHGKYE